MPIDYVFAARTPEYYLTDRDLVKVESHVYAQQVAYTLGGGSVPQAIPVSSKNGRHFPMHYLRRVAF